MAPRNSKSKSAGSVHPKVAVQCLESSEKRPPQLFILPKIASTEARIVSLANPATSKLNRYYYCPQTGLYEFTKIGSSPSTPRSWLIARSPDDENTAETTTDDDATQDEDLPMTQKAERSITPIEHGYVLQDADIFAATPLDPLFFLTPIVPGGVAAESKNQYRLEDDYIDTLGGLSQHMAQLLHEDGFRQRILQRLRVISNVKDIGEKVYKLEPYFLLKELIRKAANMITRKSWPASLEETYVRARLEAPVAIVPREVTIVDASENDSAIILNTEMDSSIISSDFQTRSPSLTAQPVDIKQDIASAQIPDLDFVRYSIPTATVGLLRLRVSLDFLLSSYMPRELRESLRKILDSNRIVDFNPINQHLEHLKKLRSEAQALRSLSDNISRKRSAEEDDEAVEIRAEKKRQKEDEEKRRKAETRATKDLKKVNTTGMKKLNCFFKKATPT